MKTTDTSTTCHRKTFAEAYCSQHDIPPEQYAISVLKASLYPMARLCYPFLRRLSSGYFQADLDLIRATGRLKHTSDYQVEVQEFINHPANSGFFRNSLDMRVSTGRLRRLLRHTLRSEAASIKTNPNTAATYDDKEDNNETALPFSLSQTDSKETSEKRHHA